MNLNLTKPIDRRRLLRGAGACLALPLLDAMIPAVVRAAPSRYRAAARSLSAQPRMMFNYIPNGVNIEQWLPRDSGRNWTLSPTLRSLRPYRNDFTLFSNLGQPNGANGHEGADYWLTGADLRAAAGKDYQNSISVDQVAAELHGRQTRFPSLELAQGSGAGQAGHSHTLAFDRNGTPLPCENSPPRLFARLFGAPAASSRRATLDRYAEQRSVLDEVLAEATALRKQLGKVDQEKLDQYLNSVRETERRVQRLEAWVDRPKPKISAQGLQLNARPDLAHDRVMWIDVMLDLSYLAFQTDSTRIITFEWAREASGWGGNGENQHELSHHGGDAGMMNQLAGVDRFYIARLGRFLGLLKSTREADGNMLDRTMTLFGSGMNNGRTGTHSPKNLPTLLAGGAKLGLKHGQHIAVPGDDPPLCNLLLTMLQKMGIEADSFSNSTGTLNGLT